MCRCPIERVPTHEGTDLDYIQQLARSVGYVFYIEPGPVPGTNIAYFGPEIKIGVPQPALNIDMDAHTNVESLSFTLRPEQGRAAGRAHPEPADASADPDSDPARSTRCSRRSARIPAPHHEHQGAERHREADARCRRSSRGLAEAAKSQDAVSGTGTLDVLRYGRLLKARSWSACAAPGSRSTASTTSRGHQHDSSAASSSRASRCRATASCRSRRRCRHEQRQVSTASTAAWC